MGLYEGVWGSRKGGLRGKEGRRFFMVFLYKAFKDAEKCIATAFEILPPNCLYIKYKK